MPAPVLCPDAPRLGRYPDIRLSLAPAIARSAKAASTPLCATRIRDSRGCALRLCRECSAEVGEGVVNGQLLRQLPDCFRWTIDCPSRATRVAVRTSLELAKHFSTVGRVHLGDDEA